MTLTKEQARLVAAHAKAHDVKAHAVKKLGLSNNPSYKIVRDIVSCSYDRSLTRKIAGTASTPTICNDNRSYLSRGAILKVPIPLLYKHGGSPIGQVTFMSKTATQIFISAVIFDNSQGNFAWEMFQQGEMNGLSCKFEDLHMLAKVDGVEFYNRYKIVEVSVTRHPKNPDCSFRCFDEGGKF